MYGGFYRVKINDEGSNGRTSIKGIWIGFEKDNKCIVIKVKTCFELIYKRIKRRYNIETW